MEEISNQNKEKSGENLENEFKINQEMEIQADILGINLEKLKAEINAMGGVEKFRELANKGLQEYKGEQGETGYYGNSTEGEKIFQGMASCLSDLRNFSAEKAVGLSSGILGTAGIIVAEANSGELGVELLFFVSLIAEIPAGVMLISAIKKKIQHHKLYLKAKMAEMKLKLTGSINRQNALASEPKEKKLNKEVRKRQEKILTEEQEKNPSIDKFL